MLVRSASGEVRSTSHPQRQHGLERPRPQDPNPTTRATSSYLSPPPPPATRRRAFLELMMASNAGTAGAAYISSSGSRYSTVVANHQLARQRSVPAALASAFASCGGRGGERPRRLGDGRGGAPASRPPAGGGVVRALLAWVGRGSKAAVMARSGSSSVKEQQYGHDEYAHNFDEDAAAGEPENLSRSFSARYARRALWRDGAR